MKPWTHTGFAQELVFGAGSVKRVSDVLKALGARRVLLVTTEGRNDSDDGARVARRDRLVAGLDVRRGHVARAGAVGAAGHAAGARATPSMRSCRSGEGRAPTRARPSASSPSKNPARRAPRLPTVPRSPHIAIPTTYSGAELTGFFGMTDPAARQKTGAGGPTITPMGAIYDPELTLSTPPR